MKNTELETCHLMIYDIIDPCLKLLLIYNLSSCQKLSLNENYAWIFEIVFEQ